MIKCLFAIIILCLCIVMALPVIMIAVPGILFIVALGLFFRWLDKAAASDPANHDDNPRR